MVGMFDGLFKHREETEKMSEEQRSRQACISCDGEGHTYLSCPRVNFGSIIAGGLGVADFSGRSDDTRSELAKIKDERQEKHRNGEISSRVVTAICLGCNAVGAGTTYDPEETTMYIKGFPSCKRKERCKFYDS